MCRYLLFMRFHIFHRSTCRFSCEEGKTTYHSFVFPPSRVWNQLHMHACMHVSRLEASNLKSDQTIFLSCTADGAETETRRLRPPYQTGKRRSRFREYDETVKINPGIGADFVVSNLASIGLFRPVSSKSSLLTPSPPTRPRTRIWTLDHGFPFALIFALSYSYQCKGGKHASRTLNAVKVRLAHLPEPLDGRKDAKWITATAIGLLLQCYTSNKERRRRPERNQRCVTYHCVDRRSRHGQ